MAIQAKRGVYWVVSGYIGLYGFRSGRSNR